MDHRLRHPFSCLVSGGSGCGKTEFLSSLLHSDALDTRMDDIVICYSEWQPAYEKLREKCRFVKGLIDPEDLDPAQTHLLIIDDLMDPNDKRIEQFFIRGSHHHNSSVFYVVQNLFNQSRGHRNCSLNAHYMIIFGSARDRRQIVTLGQQMFPDKKNYLIDSYNAACEKPFSYLFVDLKPDTPNHLRLRGRILDMESQDVYVPKDYIWNGFQK